MGVNSAVQYDEFVKNVRKSGLTIKEFALLIKVSPTSITNYSTADRLPNNLVIISTLLKELSKNDIDCKAVLMRIGEDLVHTMPKVNRFGACDKQMLSGKE